MKTKNKTKKNNINIKRMEPSKKGGSILDSIAKSIIHVPKKKNYTVRAPGMGLIRSLSSFTNSEKQNQEKILSIIFNYRLYNEIDITNTTQSSIISSNSITREPYILLDSMGKYLIVMYREINKKNLPVPKLLLHFLIGFINRIPIKIFPYNAPNIKSGKIQSFVIKLYKCPATDNTQNFIKINNINKKEAYKEFSTYISINKLLPINTFRFMVKGEIGASGNLFDIMSRQKNIKMMAKS
jgi:hypothetical protein